MPAKRTIKRYMGFMSLAFVFLFIISTEARAEPYVYGFEAITANSTIDPGIGEAQLSVEVTPSGEDVLFTFRNAGPLASSITDIYFEDGTLLGIANIVNSTGVSFLQGANPPDLPGGETLQPPFNVTAGFSADSNPPAQPNGVNPDEWVGIVFNLENGKTFGDVIAAIVLGFTDPDPGNDASLRIGIHVQGFADGDSESFIMTPIPASVVLGILGLGVAGLKLRRFV